MKKRYKNIIIETIVLCMLMGLTSCNNGAADSQTTDETVESTSTETEPKVTSTSTPRPTPEIVEQDTNNDFHLYTDWDNYSSGKADKEDLPESKYNRLSPEFINRYEAGTSDGYIYPFSPYGDGAIGFVDESGTIVCDNVYYSTYPNEEHGVNCWAASKYEVYHGEDYDTIWDKYDLIAFDGSFVLDNNGEGYDSYEVGADYIYCTSFDDDGVTLVDVFDFEGENLLHSEFQSPLPILFEEFCNAHGYFHEPSIFDYIYQTVSLFNEHYAVYSGNGFSYTLDLLTGEVIDTSDFSSYAWEDTFLFSDGYAYGYDIGNDETILELHDGMGELRAVIEGFDSVYEVAPNRFFASAYGESVSQIVDIDGNLVFEAKDAYNSYSNDGIISNGHLYSYDGEDLGEYSEDYYRDHYSEFADGFYSCYIDGKTFISCRDSELNIEAPENLGECQYYDIWAGSHTMLVRDYDNNVYYMFDTDNDEILFVYHEPVDQEKIDEMNRDYEELY